jgi:hypothetical protein
VGPPVESAGPREPAAGTAGPEPGAELEERTGQPAGRVRMLGLSSAPAGGHMC